MIRVGYYYLLGTNIEVGVRRVSKAGKFAVITFRHGKHHFGMRGMKPKDKLIQAKVHKQIVVPCGILTKKCSFTKRGKLKAKNGDFHLDGENPPPLDLKKDFLIWGVIPGRVKSYDKINQVVTFNTTPRRRAHVSVLRNNPFPQPSFDSRVPTEKKPVDLGFLTGTNLEVKMLLEAPRISLYRVGQSASWIPHELITSSKGVEEYQATSYNTIGEKFLFGFIPVEAYTAEGTDNILFRLGKSVFWTKREHVQDTKGKLRYLCDFRKEEKEAYLQDQKSRINSLRPVI